MIVSITVHNHNDPECRRLSLTRHYAIDPSAPLVEQLSSFMSETEQTHRMTFPKGSAYSVPFTEVEVTPTEVITARAMAASKTPLLASEVS